MMSACTYEFAFSVTLCDEVKYMTSDFAVRPDPDAGCM